MAQDLGEAAIAIEDGAISGDRRGSLVHLLHQHAVGLVRPLERVDARPVRALDDQRVHLAGSERTQRLLGLLQSEAQLLELQLESSGLPSSLHRFSRRSRPKSTFSTFARLPMYRRSGAGRTLISVGVAKICSSRASAGFW